MKYFFLKILLLLPILLILAGVNYFVDPVHLTEESRYEKGIACLLLRGENVTNIYHPNEAAILNALVYGFTAPKDILVLGSSRSKLIRSTSFLGYTFFNNSISGGKLCDYRDLYRMYKGRHLDPKIVIVEVSPWIIDGYSPSKWRFAITQNDSVPSTGQMSWFERIVPEYYIELLSPGYFQTSFFTLCRGLLFPSDQKVNYFVFHDGDLPVGETLLIDGSAVYPERVRHSEKIEKVRAEAVAYAANPAYIPPRIEDSKVAEFESFIKMLLQDNIRVILYLPPYHPKSYELLVENPKYKSLIKIQEYFVDFGNKNHLTVVGRYNPSEIAFQETDFFDGSHPNDGAMKRLLQNALPVVTSKSTFSQKENLQIRLMGISTSNGIEAVNGKLFFWIGTEGACLNVDAQRTDTAVMILMLKPGPSIPKSVIRNLRVTTSYGFQTEITIKKYPELSVQVPVRVGMNEICLTPLDKPTVSILSNGDKRPLILGVMAVNVQYK